MRVWQSMNVMWYLVGLSLLPGVVGQVSADNYYVAVDGVDAADRDGMSKQTAWASLAYACDRVPEGAHAIHVGPGEYTATRTAYPKPGLAIVGRKPWGKDVTRITASTDWPLCEEPHQQNPADEYLIAFEKSHDLHIHSLALVSHEDHRITGAIRCARSQDIHIHDVVMQNFRWNGVLLEHSRNIRLHDCRIENASTDRSRYWGGLIRTRWLKDSEVFNNRVVSHVGGGYGYKGGGHEAVRIHHNVFDIRGGFAIESAHENEYGVEIDHNFANHCISIPKGGQAADPATRGYDYSFHIHHNYLTHSYTIEGPRNHLRFDHNYVHIDHTNGRVYTHHGGINRGPVWIHHNVIENVDRALVWMNQGRAENIYIYNNTVAFADAGPRAGTALAGHPERVKNWVARNNVFVAPWSQPRHLVSPKNVEQQTMTVTDNLCVNMLSVPPGNLTDGDPGLRREGSKPAPFYVPVDEDSPVVAAGKDVDLPFSGTAPTLGAVELDFQEAWNFDDVPELWR